MEDDAYSLILDVHRAVTIFQKCIAIYCDIWEVYCNNITIYCPNKKGAFLRTQEKIG